MAERNKPEAVEKANSNYQDSLNFANAKVQEAKEKGRDVNRRKGGFLVELKEDKAIINYF